MTGRLSPRTTCVELCMTWGIRTASRPRGTRIERWVPLLRPPHIHTGGTTIVDGLCSSSALFLPGYRQEPSQKKRCSEARRSMATLLVPMQVHHPT